MAHVRDILTKDHPLLRKMAKRVGPGEIFDPFFQKLIDDMLETMYRAEGIGLAAPQVNSNKRLFVIDLQDGERDHGPLVIINPVLAVGEGENTSLEVCLSVPGMIGDVQRYERVLCIGLDRKGRKLSVEATGLFGNCIQHELDHLNGILYIDKAQNIRPAKTGEEKEIEEESARAVS